MFDNLGVLLNEPKFSVLWEWELGRNWNQSDFQFLMLMLMLMLTKTAHQGVEWFNYVMKLKIASGSLSSKQGSHAQRKTCNKNTNQWWKWKQAFN